MKILGVDLGSYSIKVAELDVTSKGHTLSSFHEIPLTQDPNKDQGLELIEKLRELSGRYDPAKTRWVIAIPQHRVSVHNKTFPFRDRIKILKSLPFELEDDIPLNADETTYDAKTIQYTGPLSHLLTVASPNEAIEEVLALSKDGGFDPDIISVEGLALANIFENWNAAPVDLLPKPAESALAEAPDTAKPARLILHMGHTRSLLLVYSEGGLVSVRSILWGGADVARDLAKVFSLPFAEAVKLLKTKSFILMNKSGASKDQLLLSQTITGSVNSLLQELRLTLLDVRSTFKLEFKAVELTGGMSQVQNLAPYITQTLEIPANVAKHLSQHGPTLFPITPQTEASAALAVGLAIEGLKKPRNPAINLRKGEFARENVAFQLFWQKWRVPVQVAAAMLLIFFIYSMVRDSMASSLLMTAEETVGEVARKEAGLKGSAALESGIRRYIKTQDNQLRLREELTEMSQYVSAMDILTKLSEKLPVVIPPSNGRGINVTHFSLENDTLSIEGRALEPALVPRIETALGEIAIGKSVKKAPPSNVPNGPGTAFAFTMKVKRKP